MQFLCELFKKLVRTFLMYWGKSYTTYIKQVLACDFQITLENGNIDGGGKECNFSLIIYKKNVCYFSYQSTPPTLLRLESPNLYT